MKSVALIFLILATGTAFAIVGDFNGDCIVNFTDYAYLSNNWLGSGTGDLNSSGSVDINDLVIFANYWLEDNLPEAASSPDPSSGATGVAITKILSWSRPTGATGDVWFNGTRVLSNTSSTSYDPNITYSTTYTWSVDIIDGACVATGATWSFTTVDAPAAYCPTNPDAATTPSPSNHATGVALSTTLTWNVADCNGEETLNDVWFGETGSMVKVVSESGAHNYSPSLEKSHIYQWRIDTVNEHGTTEGAVWDFNAIVQDAPVASDGTASAYTYIVCPITLIATDDGLSAPPARLKYVITELPADVNAYLQDPTSGGQARIDANNLPYKLSSWGNTVWFATSTVGVTTFKFEAFDGELYSVETQVDVNTIANPKDCLSFDGSGFVTIPDTNNYFDIEPNRGVEVCFATRQPFCTLFKKWELGKGGYWVGLIGGYISARVYDNNGTVLAEQRSGYRYDNDVWANVVVGFNQVYERLELYTSAPVGEEVYTEGDAASFPLALWPAANDCNFIIGTGYRYEIDAIRSYNLAMTDVFRVLSSWQIHTEAGDVSMFVPNPIVRFKCNFADPNNTATQIYDDKSAQHLIGTFSDPNHVKYEPFFWHWYDSAAMHHLWN